LKSVRGFTLIEILVVLFIVSIIISMVSLNPHAFTSNASLLRNFSDELVLRLRFAKEYAISSQATIGMGIQPTAWDFQFFNQDRWESLDSPKPLQARTTPRDIHLSIQSENSRTPQIIFYGSGEVTPFIIECELQKASVPVRIIGKANGDITLENSTP
jgi:general secretion pathway protein H